MKNKIFIFVTILAGFIILSSQTSFRYSLLTLASTKSELGLNQRFQIHILTTNDFKTIQPMELFLSSKEIIYKDNGPILVELKNDKNAVVWKNYLMPIETGTIGDCAAADCDSVSYTQLEVLIPARNDMYSLEVFDVRGNKKISLYSEVIIENFINWLTLVYLNTVSSFSK